MKKIIFTLLLFVCTIGNAQKSIPDYKIDKDTSFTALGFYNYFTGGMDTNYFLMGQFILVSYDSIFDKGDNSYRIKIINPDDGKLEVYYRNKLLYMFPLKDGFVTGVGFGYYIADNRVALQGNFKNGKLDGLLFIFDYQKRVYECMEYKKGKFLKSIYYINAKSEEDLKLRNSKRTSENPLRGDELIILY
ncbi:MAG TPA: hypothetical protein DD434_05565 [Bacteroidales bacterium]|nr:hypothetical protein [Bacteroidales bacterium]